MSPAQLAQIRLRLDRVAEQRRAAAEPVQIKCPSAKVAKQWGQALADAAGLKPVTNASKGAARVAKHKAKNPEAVRAKNAATKRASRAKGANRG